jgi:hypothetical protein
VVRTPSLERKLLLAGAWVLAAAQPFVIEMNALAQPAQERPSFELASVKAMLADDPNSDYIPRRSGNRITMHNAALGTIIAWAYHLTNAEYQLVAAPSEKHLWDDYDIRALAPGSPNDDDLRMMFQTLLGDRFQLKVHREKRELAAFDLVVAKVAQSWTRPHHAPLSPALALGAAPAGPTSARRQASSGQERIRGRDGRRADDADEGAGAGPHRYCGNLRFRPGILNRARWVR